MSLYRGVVLIAVPFSHENLRTSLNESEPSADLLCSLGPPFELDDRRLKVILKVLHRGENRSNPNGEDGFQTGGSLPAPFGDRVDEAVE